MSAALRHQVGPCTLYRGDAREILHDLRAQADCLVTDWPYPLTSGGRGKVGDGSMGGKFAADVYANDGILFPTVGFFECASALFAALRPRAHAYVMVNDRHEAEARVAMERAGFRFHRLLVWDTGHPKPNRWYMGRCEFTLFMFKGEAFRIAAPGSQQLFSHRPVSSAHPTEKPVPLMSQYITNSTIRGDTVLDPFMGTGTTIEAALWLGRSAIGIEIDPRWFDAAVARVEAVWAEVERGGAPVSASAHHG
jgi:site-specific DNA-methyltransferase (adenine-specific)